MDINEEDLKPESAENEAPSPALVTISEDQLNELIAQLEEYKADITILVSVLNGLQGLFSGKGSIMSIVPVVTKLIGDKEKMNELAAIVPVLEKYIAKPSANE